MNTSGLEAATPASGETLPSPGGIVVGLDRSPHSRRALGWALEIARPLGVGCHVVHVWEVPALAMAYPTAVLQSLADMTAAARAFVKSAVAEADTSGVVVTTTAIRGAAGPTLVEVARTSQARMIVVGSLGHGALVGAVLGSVSQYCLHHAGCPVVVVPQAQAAWLPAAAGHNGTA